MGDKPERLSIDELERLLQNDEETPIEILPDGTIRAGKGERRPIRPPLIQHHYMGEEY